MSETGGPLGAVDAPSLAARRVLWVILLVQFVALCIYSRFLFDRGALSPDFATYAQAWTQIGTGHFDPFDSIAGFPFWRIHLELAMWPLALLHLVDPSPVVLSWLQDFAMVAAEFLTLRWLARVVRSLERRRADVVFTAAGIFLVLTPVWYETASFDFHFEVLGAPFLVAAASALWSRRSATAIVSTAIAVLFGAEVAVIAAAVGLAFLFPVGRGWRWRAHAGALGVLAVAAAWYTLVLAVGGDRGTNVSGAYGYLAGNPAHAGILAILVGAVAHPSRWWRVLVSRRWSLLRALSLAGLFGVLTPLGAFVVVADLLPAVLYSNPALISETGSFQSLNATPLMLVASVSVLVRILGGDPTTAARWRRRARQRTAAAHRWRLGVAVVMALAVVAGDGVRTVQYDSQFRVDWWTVSAPAGAVIEHVVTSLPLRNEAIVSEGIIGRFAAHAKLFDFHLVPQQFPVEAPVVDFVFAPVLGRENVRPAQCVAAIDYAIQKLGGRLVITKDTIVVVQWHPPPGTRTVVLP